MADKKISQLSSASTPLAGTEVLPIVQSSATVKVATDDLTVKNIRSNATTGILQVAGPAAAATRTMTVPDANFTAARTDAAQTFTGDQTLGTGNLIIGTANKGIDFSANTNAAGMTSELLNDYEEGTWTPIFTTEAGGSGQVYSKQSGRYTKIGRQVVAGFEVTLSDKGTLSGTYIIIGGLPFSAAGTGNDLDAGALFVSFFANLATNQIFLAGYAVAASGAWVTTTDAAGTAMDNLRVTDVGNTTRIAGTIVYTT